MKKLFFLLIIFCAVHSSAQVAIEDAKKLKAAGTQTILERSDGVLELPESDEVIAIVKYYVPAGDTADDVKIKSDFKTNPFIAFGSISHTRNVAAGTTDVSALFQPTLSGIGNLDVTNIANGIAQFMIDRAKEELTVAFFNRFKDFAEKNPEFGILFPKTTDNLENLLSYKYPEMLPALRVGFFEDLKNMTLHLDEVLELPRYKKLLQNFPEVRVAIRSIRLVQQLASGNARPVDLFSSFADFPEWKDTTASPAFQNFGSSVRLANIISNSLLDQDGDRSWVPVSELNDLVQDTILFRIYLGLVYQKSQTENIVWYTGKNNTPYSFCQAMKEQKDNLFLFENKLIKFIELGKEVSKRLDTLDYRRKNDMPATKEDYYNYIGTAINITEYGFSFAQVFNTKLDISQYTIIVRKANDLYLHLYKEEYTQALINAMDILGGVSDLLVKERARIDNMNKATVQASPALTAKADALHNTKDLDNLIKVIAQLTKYGVFMANMVEAKTPEEVASILDNAVLPVGSSSIKKNTDFNIAVQSYLGAYWRFNRLKHPTQTAWSDQFGVSAPIGLSFSHGFGKVGSASLFLPLFDLGAVVDYRLRRDSVADVNGNNTPEVGRNYKIRLGQIVSPGAYLVYGFGANLPLSFGVGGQYGPGLSKIDGTGATTVINPQWRWSLFLAVDIPFFNLKSTDKKYK